MNAAHHSWPDRVDILGIVLFGVVICLLPLLGYWLTALDIRAYLRALRGMLVRIREPNYQTPNWVLKQNETPPCLRALGLSWPCTEDDVKQAYRRLAKEWHPDRGGQIERFLALQQQLEQSLHFVRQRSV